MQADSDEQKIFYSSDIQVKAWTNQTSFWQLHSGCLLRACETPPALSCAGWKGRKKKWLWGFLQNQIIASENLQENCLFFFFFLTSIFPFMQGKQAAEQSLQAFGFLYFLCKEKADAQEPQQNCWRWEFKAGSRMGKICFFSAYYHTQFCSV